MENDPEIPGEGRLQESLVGFVFGTVSVGLIGLLAHLSEEPFIFPSLGPTAYLIFHRPNAAASSPRNTVLGHLVGAVSGLFSLWICGLWDAPNALVGGVTLPRALAAALSLGGTSAFMTWFRVGHPPAGATTLIVSLGLMSSPWQLVILMSAVLILVLEAHILHRLAGGTYPLWSKPK